MALNPSPQDKRGIVLKNFDGTFDAENYPLGNKPTPTIPDAITDLSISSIEPNSASLTWTLPSGTDNVDVYRRDVTTSGSFALITTLGAVSSHNDSGLTAENQYEWKVVAKNAAGNSADSNVASGTTTAPIMGGTPVERQFSILIEGDSTLIGESPQSPDGILNGRQVFTGGTGAANGVDKGQFSNEYQYNGRTSIKCTIPAGFTGSGSFGGIVDLNGHADIPARLQKGDEMWVSVRIYIPTDYIFNDGRSKFLRAQVAESSGHNDLYLTPNDANVPIEFIDEPGVNSWISDDLSGKSITPGVWQTYEMYLRFDDVSGSTGGLSLVKAWVDGVLELEADTIRPLNSATDAIRNFKFLQWWGNGGSPVSQSIYLDKLELRSSVPPNTDASGFPYIGV